MRIVYDYQIFSRQARGGITRYFAEIAARIAKLPDSQVEVWAGAHFSEGLDSSLYSIIGRFVPKIRGVRVPRRALNRQFTKHHAQSTPPDVFHETYYDACYYAPTSSKRIVTVHDMILEKYLSDDPKLQEDIRAKALAVRAADHVICVSKNTRIDLLNTLPIDPSRVSVVPLGCSFSPGAPGADLARATSRPYILYVGTRDTYKNFATLLAAYNMSPRIMRDFDVVAFGSVPITSGEKDQIAALAIPLERVVHRKGNDASLASAYAGASAFVCPSRYEGFGLPPLEAMACNCPVICSNTSSLPEVVGDAGLYFNPDDPDELAHALETVLYDRNIADALRAAGLMRVPHFTWDQCAQATRDVYARALMR